MVYFIWDRLRSSQIKAECGCCPRQFETETEAQEYINTYRESRRSFLRIKPWRTEPWAVTARLELQEQAVTRPIWYHEPWYQEREDEIGAYPRIHKNDPNLVEYYPSLRDGARGKLTTTTPGRFLKKFFADTLNEQAIKEWSEKHKSTFVDVDRSILKWAKTPEEIQAVYELPASFFSCMQEKVISKWGHQIGHPTRAYGAGDLQVAYITEGYNLVARALVWPERGLVGRVYGNDTLLRQALKAYGIHTQSDVENYDNFVGARLLYIPLTTPVSKGYIEKYYRPDNVQPKYPPIVVPYIDGQTQRLKLCDDGFLRIEADPHDESKSQYYASSEQGYAYSHSKCARCDGWHDGGERAYLTRSKCNTTVDRTAFVDYCGKCKNELAFYCCFTNQWYPRDAFTPIEDNGSFICLENNLDKVFISALTGQYKLNSRKIKILFGREIASDELYPESSKLTWIESKNDWAITSDLIYFKSGRINFRGSELKAKAA
jgi:hypothetical protein